MNTMTCGSCKHFSPDKKHKSTGGCALHRRMVMRMGGCYDWDKKPEVKNNA